MAESDKANSLSEDYLLKDIEEKLKVDSEPEEKSAEKETVVAAPVDSSVSESVPAESPVSESVPAAPEENVSAPPPPANEDVTEPPPTATEETTEVADEGNTEDEKPEIKLETAPGDYRFPTTNQSRHCFTRYVEYHRCVAAKGEDASECDKFAKYYRALCPGEWVDRWNEQRENGTFPGPL